MNTKQINEYIKNRPAGMSRRQAKREAERLAKQDRDATRMRYTVIADDALLRCRGCLSQIRAEVDRRLPTGVTWLPDLGQLTVEGVGAAPKRSKLPKWTAASIDWSGLDQELDERADLVTGAHELIWAVRGHKLPVTVTEIAERLGMHRTTVNDWTRRDDFPAPVGEIAGARVWHLHEVIEWREGADLSPGRPRKG